MHDLKNTPIHKVTMQIIKRSLTKGNRSEMINQNIQFRLCMHVFLFTAKTVHSTSASSVVIPYDSVHSKITRRSIRYSCSEMKYSASRPLSRANIVCFQ
jgi:hypothetical protein